MNRVHRLCYLAALWFHLRLLQGQKGLSGSPANWMELCWSKSFISPTSLDKAWIWSFSLRFSCLSLLTSPITSILQNLLHTAIRHDTPHAHCTCTQWLLTFWVAVIKFIFAKFFVDFFIDFSGNVTQTGNRAWKASGTQGTGNADQKGKARFILRWI